MEAQQKAKQLYDDAYSRWCTELSHDKNKLIAKAIATYVCDELLEYTKELRIVYLIDNDEYLLDVKEEILKL